MNFYKPALAILTAVLLTVNSRALFADELPQIFVTATRSEQPPDQLNVSTRTITRKEILDSQTADVGALLQQLTTIDFGKNGGAGQASSLFMRGSESNHTLVLLDGVKLNPATLGGAALQNLRLDQISRIEISKGPRSTLYGSEAIGGVIQIFTRRSTLSKESSISLGGGSNSTKRVTASLSQSGKHWRGGVNLGYDKTDGFPARIEGKLNSGHDNTAAQGFLAYRGTHWNTELNYWQGSGNTQYYDFLLATLDQDYKNSISSFTVKSLTRSDVQHTITLSEGRDEITQNQSSDFAFSRRRTLDWQTNIKNKSLWTMGATVSKESTQADSFGSSFDKSTLIAAGFVQQQHFNGRHHGLWALRYSDHDAFDGYLTGELSYGAELGNNGYTFIAATTGFRAPDAIDRFGFGGNPDLDPEVSRNIEIGLRQRRKNHRYEVSLYQNQIKDLIIFNDPDGFLGPAPGINQNIDEARITGIELSHRVESGPWSSIAEVAINNPKNQLTGTQLPRRSKQNLRWQGRYNHNNWQAGVELVARSSRPDSDFNDEINHGYSIVNLTGQLALTPVWTLSTRIENIFDKDYTLAHGFNTQGRGVWLQLRASGRH